MKNRKFLAALMLSAVVITGGMAEPGTGYGVHAVQAADVRLSSTKLILSVGQIKTLKLTGTKEKITWSSSNKSIAAVSAAGKVSAKKAGTAKITAKAGKKNYTCVVTVKAAAKQQTVTLNGYQFKMPASWKKTNSEETDRVEFESQGGISYMMIMLDESKVYKKMDEKVMETFYMPIITYCFTNIVEIDEKDIVFSFIKGDNGNILKGTGIIVEDDVEFEMNVYFYLGDGAAMMFYTGQPASSSKQLDAIVSTAVKSLVKK